MVDITPTLDMIDGALGSQGSAPVPPISGPKSDQNNGPKSTADQTMDVLQAGIDGTLPEPPKPYETTTRSLGMNALARANETLANTVGGPVDLVNYGLKKAGVPVSDKPFGGSESIKGAMGLIHANPDEVQPQNEAERIAGGIGAGVGGALLLPLGGEALAAGKVISPATAQIVRSATGAPDAMNAAIGGASGAGSTIAADVVPDPYKPIAGMVGGLVAGAPVVAGHAVVTAGKAGYDALPAITEAGKDAKARATVATEMQSAASDPVPPARH